jgi:SNF2 family DNA or RNA helicase
MFVHNPTKTLVLQAPDPLYIRSLLPKASRTLGQTSDGNVAVRHSLETVRILRNIGLDAPSPVLSQYQWPGKYTPFDHQYVMADFLTTHDKCFNLSEMGTGKTYPTLWSADYLMSIGVVKRALILAPLSTIRTVWEQDIFDVLLHRSVAVAHGSLQKRERALNSDVDFYIVNHDGIALKDVAQLVRRRTDIDLIILDEASFFKNHNTDKYKFLNWVLEKKKRFWCITGTPAPEAPHEAWAICKLVDPTSVPKFKGAFKRMTMMEISRFKWAPRKGAEDIVFAAMRPAIRFLKKDCLTLPPQITVKVQTQLSKQQIDAYGQMMDDMIITDKQGIITAVNAADKITKLRQVLCGVIKDPETGKYRVLDHKPRVDDLCDTIDQAAAKVIVIVPFKGIIKSLGEELVRRGYTVGLINGDVSPGARNRIIGEFKTQKDPHILLCHPKVMAHGLNLTVADYTIFYAPIYSHDEYRQACERNNRTGQKLAMTVVRMAAHPLEWQIYRQLDNKGITQDNILGLYRNIIEQGHQ